ncbi:MAG: hypothetical protein QY329_12520 [Anaerolineales bacterium]|nr:MAG: hypothetical protein QY329_12520 [Anaerolineales bacterium]
MQKFSVAYRILLTVFILLLNGCNQNVNSSGNSDVQINELNNIVTSYDETVHINNCGGKADSEQTKSRSFSTSIEGGLNVGVQQIAIGAISAKYSQSRSATVSQRLVAPAGTNMEFVLRWSEEVHAGNVTVNGSTGTYKASIPIAVEQASSQDLGCGGLSSNPNPQPAPTQQNVPAPSFSMPSFEFIYREATGGYVTKKYNVTLGNGEVIAGQGYGFQQYTGCVAFIIRGAGEFSFSVTDGSWLYFKNVTSTDQVELLLQNQVDSLITLHI